MSSSTAGTGKPAAAPAASSGLLSGVFSFVSREIESFLTTASGGTISQGQEGPYPEEPDDGQNSSEDGDTVHGGGTNDIARRRTTHREDSCSSPHPYRRAGHRRDHRPSKPTRRSRKPSPEHEASSSDSRPPSPPPLPRALKRRPSISMPGSLFPRSPSIDRDEPEGVPEADRRVRFSLGSLTSSTSKNRLDDSENEAGPSRSPQTNQRSSSPRRPHLVPSVKAAVQRFRVGENDADPSILLPSPTNSPVKSGNTENYSRQERQAEDYPPRISARSKGKQRATDDSLGYRDLETQRELRVRGKEQELLEAKEEQRRKEKRREQEEEREISMDEETRGEKEADKEKIRMLEDEIQRLKEELSKRPIYTPSIDSFPPPPPPPPPPPSNPVILRLPTSGTDPSMLFTSARAALKHAPAPKEAPINPPAPSRRQGQPTIGITADKMAAFLTEMKTVRLRKVSGTPSLSTSVSGPSQAPRPPVLRHSASLQRIGPSSSSFASTSVPSGSAMRPRIQTDTRVGEKRKRAGVELGSLQDELAAKRRSFASSSDSSFASASTSSAPSQPLPSSDRASTISSSSFSQSIPHHVWNTSSIPDAPTPSLCSDNGEREDETSPEEHPPSTPPVGPSRAIFRFRGTGIPVESEPDERSQDIIDVDMLDEPQTKRMPSRDASNPPQPAVARESRIPRRTQHIFDKRPPSSPMPHKSPRRPKAPTRAPRPAPPPPPPNGSDEEDPLSLSFSSPEPPNLHRPSPALNSSRRSLRLGHGSTSAEPPQEPQMRRSTQEANLAASRTSRRWTLDDELRNASWHDDREADEEDLDSGVLTGVGTMSKRRGFLAHGGAGGVPVFMGVGYVEGAEEEDAGSVGGEDSDEYLPKDAGGSKPSTTRHRRPK